MGFGPGGRFAMMPPVDWLWYILLLPVLDVGFFPTLLNLPGNWVMILATAGYAAITRPR